MAKKAKLGVPAQRASDALEIAAQEAEHKRLALELHDGVGQILTEIKLRLQSITKSPSLRSADQAVVAKLSAHLDQAIAQIRRISRNLMPPDLENLGLERALNRLCRDYEEYCGGEVAIRTVATHATPELSLTVFRVAREALNNIGKQSPTTKVAVSLSCDGDDIVLVVKDNGAGFRQHGVGLSNMRRRAEASGGRLEVFSRPGEGTTLVLRLPASGPSRL